MNNIFTENFSRRNFIKAAGFFAASYFIPKIASANEFIKTEFKTLDEMNIGKTNLVFDAMDLREYTGAIVVHHSGLLKGDVDSTVADIHEMHIVKNKWSGIGYHFVIHKDGFVEFARPLEYQGAHTFKNNEFTVGICLAGNYQIGEPPQEQLQSAVQLIGALCEKYKFPPTDTTIFGHRDLGKTSCPGKNLYVLLPDIIYSSRKILKLT